jgi:hypothetical protein
MFKHIIPLTNRNIEELQSSQKKWKVIDLSTERNFHHWRQSVSYKHKNFRMDNVLKN